MPCVVKKVQSALGNAEINSSIPADEVTAVGAAKQVDIQNEGVCYIQVKPRGCKPADR